MVVALFAALVMVMTMTTTMMMTSGTMTDQRSTRRTIVEAMPTNIPAAIPLNIRTGK